MHSFESFNLLSGMSVEITTHYNILRHSYPGHNTTQFTINPSFSFRVLPACGPYTEITFKTRLPTLNLITINLSLTLFTSMTLSTHALPKRYYSTMLSKDSSIKASSEKRLKSAGFRYQIRKNVRKS
jgi:hypothetical protein